MINQNIQENKELSLIEALIPVFILIALLAYNIVWKDGGWLGDYSNHYILLMAAAVAVVMGLLNKVTIPTMIAEIWENLKSVFTPLLILLLVGALAGTWMMSGIVPAMVYYGMQILNPTIFLAASVVICTIISLATGSSWTTTATVGIALIGIAGAMGVSLGMAAGAIISGAYFGDKMSPLSDTTNLAPALAGGELFSHIRYMALTTIPSIVITLIIFIVIGLVADSSGQLDENTVINDMLLAKFNITPWLFIVPVIVVAIIMMKVKPVIALSAGALLGAICTIIFQPEVIKEITGASTLGAAEYFSATISSLFTGTQLSLPGFVESADLPLKIKEDLPKLLSGKAMAGMLWTIYLIIAAMIFGGAMDGIGALARITKSLLSIAKTTFGLFASTVASCLVLNVTASDQYLAIVVPGKMFKKAYEDQGLAPENLSRTLEDAGTVTSVLIPWNTCGAYQSDVLGVSVWEYFIFAIFNWVSPIMTLIFAAFSIKIKQLVKKEL